MTTPTIHYHYEYGEPAVIDSISRPGLTAGPVAVHVQVDEEPSIIMSPDSWAIVQDLQPHEQARAIREWPRY